MITWKQSEVDFVNLLSDCFDVGGSLVTDLPSQYKDIDVIDSRKNTYSIKVQHSVDKYKTLLFEHTLINTNNSKEMNGSFLSCEADYYAIRFTSNNLSWWMVMPTEELKEYIGEGKWKQQHTRASTASSNKSSGWTYNKTICHAVPVKDLYFKPWTLLFVETDKGWKIHSKVKKTK